MGAITNTTVKLLYFDTSSITELNLTTDADMFIHDEGLEIGPPEIQADYNDTGQYAPIFGLGQRYGPREVTLTLGVKNFASTSVTTLYRIVEYSNSIMTFVNHPLAALYVKIGDQDGSTYAGYFRILGMSLESRADVISVGGVYGVDTLGQTLILRMKCDPFIYRDNFLNNEYTAISIAYDNGAGYTTSTEAIIDQDHPAFYVDGTNIKGDVPSPVVVTFERFDAAAGNDRPSLFFVGTNLVIPYPGSPDAGTGARAGSGWTSPWGNVSPLSFNYSNGAYIHLRLAGHVMGFLKFTNGTVGDKVFDPVGVQVFVGTGEETDIDATKIYLSNVPTGNKLVPVGMFYMPLPGRSESVVYQAGVESASAGISNLQLTLIPSWHLRAYNGGGFVLGASDKLIDDPYTNTLYTASGYAVFSLVGSPLYVYPGSSVQVRGAAIIIDANSNQFAYTIRMRMYYIPRYLHLRSIAS